MTKMIKSHKKTIYEVLGRNPVHTFPARMAPGIALDVLTETKKSIRVLDPMMGSGTVLAVARSKGHRAIGVDIDPLAVLISKVWITSIDQDKVRAKAEKVLSRAKEVFKKLPVREAYPPYADDETKRFVSYWFDGYARRQLAALAGVIARVRDQSIRDVLWCGFSRLIITKQAGASLAMDLAHSRPHKVYRTAPIKPFNKFLLVVERVSENCVHKNDKNRGPAPFVYEGDAKNLPLDDESIDLVLTSPPYLNAIDYMRCSKFSLIWMGFSVSNIRRLRNQSVGAEVGKNAKEGGCDLRDIISGLNLRPKLKSRDEAVLARYIDDVKDAVHEVARVLSPGGKAIYVIGENTIRGTFIRNAKIVTVVSELAGLKLQERRMRTLPINRRYLPPPLRRKSSASLDTRMRREVILAFTKPTS